MPSAEAILYLCQRREEEMKELGSHLYDFFMHVKGLLYNHCGIKESYLYLVACNSY